MNKPPSRWTEDQTQGLVEWYASRPSGTPLDLEQLARTAGRLKSNVCRKARELGLTDQRRESVIKVDGRYPSRVPKFATADDRNQAASLRMSEYIAREGHPRGALGIVHSAETRKKLSAASLKGWSQATPDDLEERRVKRNATNLERYGTTAPGLVTEAMHSRSTVGKREDLGGLFVRSSWEANYARYLNWLMDKGEISGWEYEADTFVFHGESRGAQSYRPDFKVTENDGSVAYHEVKGWMDGPSKTRLARMAKHYPEVKVIVIARKEYDAIKKWRDLIPNWETGPAGPKYRGVRKL